VVFGIYLAGVNVIVATAMMVVVVMMMMMIVTPSSASSSSENLNEILIQCRISSNISNILMPSALFSHIGQ
jgi:hypothetical protein